jgi:hypothetical protein
MRRAQKYLGVGIIAALVVASGFQWLTIRSAQKVIGMQEKIIEVQKDTIEKWKAQAMSCEGLVLK